ncbi:MAG: hypothetical protein CME06_00460 [Gemmatimonadetes bacterium]|nr:hypothetical protein [Gemmatimonadota bacterium]
MQVPPDLEVEWSGAEELYRDSFVAVARVESEAPGTIEAGVNVTGESFAWRDKVTFDITDFAADEIEVLIGSVSVDSVELDENSSNGETMRYYFGKESIAPLTDLGPDHYATSTDRTIRVGLATSPAGFEPLLEWRMDGVTHDRAGPRGTFQFNEVGSHLVETGPMEAPAVIDFEIYDVEVTPPDPWEEDVPVTFLARTIPSGFEDEIRWLSSTKYGTAQLVLGRGPELTVVFEDMWRL